MRPWPTVEALYRSSRPATGQESVEFAHRDIPFGLQRETAEETSEDGRDTAFTLNDPRPSSMRQCGHGLPSRPSTGHEGYQKACNRRRVSEFPHMDIPFGLQRETAKETSEDRRDTDRDEVGDIDVDRLLLGMSDEKEDRTQHELESKAVMAGWEKI